MTRSARWSFAAAAFLVGAAVLLSVGGAVGADDSVVGDGDDEVLLPPIRAWILSLPEARSSPRMEPDRPGIRDGAYGRRPSLRSPPSPRRTRIACVSRTEKGALSWLVPGFRPTSSPSLSSC